MTSVTNYQVDNIYIKKLKFKKYQSTGQNNYHSIVKLNWRLVTSID